MKDNYELEIDGHKVVLTRQTFTIDGIPRDWYKNERGNTWIPQKRSSVIGLIKQIIRDDE
jgi:hypothetical protein